jgi:hypothetical protein
VGNYQVKQLANNMATVNTVGTGTIGSSWRSKYFSNSLQSALRNMLVCEKICAVDRTDSKYIYNPYGSTPTTVIQVLAGTYAPVLWSITDDTLTVTDEFIVSEEVKDFEEVLNNYNLIASRSDEMNASVATAIDKWVKRNAHSKPTLIVSEIQKWITRAKESIISTLNDLTRGLQIMEMQKSELGL